MRRAFSDKIESIAEMHPELVFITGDLGFNAFENLKQILGNRFINAGVAEQSMVSMAAGMASQGHKVIVYSIAPFIVYRALEQIRNDVGFHNMPVLLVGNGGGYGYGIMGSSHHALNDIATISSLYGIDCYVPAFNEDVHSSIDAIFSKNKPAYLRLGLGTKKPLVSANFSAIERLHANSDSAITVIATGPVISNLLNYSEFKKIKSDIDLFSINQFPLLRLSNELELSIKKTKNVFVFEEHVEIGGLADTLSLLIHKKGINIKGWKNKAAVHYPDNRYGDQLFHQQKSGLDGQSLVNAIQSFL